MFVCLLCVARQIELKERSRTNRYLCKRCNGEDRLIGGQGPIHQHTKAAARRNRTLRERTEGPRVETPARAAPARRRPWAGPAGAKADAAATRPVVRSRICDKYIIHTYMYTHICRYVYIH